MRPNNFRISLVVTFLISVVAINTACSRSATSLKKADYCKSGHNPVATNSKAFQEKTDLNEKSTLDLAAGKYEYVSSTVYYADRERDVRVQLSHKSNESGKTTKSLDCAGGEGLNFDMEHIDFSIPFISNFAVDSAGKISVMYGNASMQIAPKDAAAWLSYNFEPSIGEPQEGGFNGLYADFPETEQIFVKMKRTEAEKANKKLNNTFEYRAQLRSLGGDKSKKIPAPFEVRILVRYKYVPASTSI